MEKHLLALLFLTGVITGVQPVNRKFYLISAGKTWTDAQLYCRAIYTDLGTIENQYEAVQIQNLALSQNMYDSAWIGLYNDANSWRWSMGNEPLGLYTKWSSPNPDNYLANEACTVILVDSWCDVPCTDLYPFVCFDGRYTGASSFFYYSNAMGWSLAQSYCRQYHTDLASIKNDIDTSYISAIILGLAWTGLFRDTWKWSDQTNFTTFSWASGEPNYGVQGEDCVSFFNGQGNDELCSHIKPFFCYAVITGKKQIAKIKVRSSQDLNAPAVKAAILDQIKQVFSHHGNITVKLREQPNGLVFNKIEENTLPVN